MGRRLVAILVTMGLLLGASGVAVAESKDDILRRGAYGNPLRIFAFFIYPAGVIVDTFAVRPLTYLACGLSGVTGCTPEEQRFLGMMEAVEEQEARARNAR